MRKWRIDDSSELYNINGWGLKYFSINEKGHVAVTPREGYASVDLKEVMDELQVRDVTAPVLLRFPDILDNRIEKISKCFRQAAEEYGYSAKNFIIYPIKVNQMRPVVEEIVSHGKKFNIGLEAGSKPELHAVLATNIDDNALIICNGYKDVEFIELALLAQKMGRHIFIVVEKIHELVLIASVAKRLKIQPNVGIRIKLSSTGSGKWEESGGDQSKFGLNSSELLEALDILEKNKMTDCLKLIHFHIGSQVTKIRRIKNALREATQFYAQLSRLGYNIDIPFRSMPTMPCRRLWRCARKTDLISLTSSRRADVRSRRIIRCSCSKCSRPHRSPRGRRARRSVRTIMSLPANFTIYGIASTIRVCSRAGMMPCRYARRRSTSSASACSTCAHALRSRNSSGP